jgi:serine/threonine-protein kinase
MPATTRFLDVYADSPRPRGLSFQQNRVALFLRILATFFSLFLVFGAVEYVAIISTGNQLWIEGTLLGDAVMAAILVLTVATWLYVKSQPRSPAILNLVDSAGTVVTCGALAALIPIVPVGTSEIAITFLLILVLVIRAAVVPSTGQRSLVVGLLATLPLALAMTVRGLNADPLTQPQVYFGGLIVFTWGAVFAVTTLVISRIIYGLRVRLRSLGSYELKERLGTGGMGEVWRAEHGMLARPAAIKMVRAATVGSSGDTTASFERFEQEAQAIARLTCPNTIHLYDFGRAEDGSFYYVMELLDGLDLETLVAKHGPQRPARVCYILQQVCRSLHEAHLVRLVHRDIKPANIYLCRYGAEQDFVKVLDFGLVKAHSEPSDVGITRDGVTVGTPAYMAPEMIVGDVPIDGRTDLYALGCVGYWLLTGTRVFEADRPTGILVKHAKEEPVPPSQRTELEVPENLERAIMACLQKNPGDRPPSAQALREELRALDLGWSEMDAAEWWRLHHPG